MENKYFALSDTLFDVTEKHAEAIDLLVTIGFENIKDENQRKSIGKAITLEAALKMKKINAKVFEKQLVDLIETLTRV